MPNNFQRKGIKSNTQIGIDFENLVITALEYNFGLKLQKRIRIPIGLHEKKDKIFDLGSIEQKIIIECKSHTWTESGNVPSAKVNAFLYDMYCLSLLPKGYQKIFVMQKCFSKKRNLTLCEYYIKNKNHLIPQDLLIYEFDCDSGKLLVKKQAIIMK